MIARRVEKAHSRSVSRAPLQKTIDNSEGRIYRPDPAGRRHGRRHRRRCRLRGEKYLRGQACGAHYSVRPADGEKTSISPLIDRSAGASDKILSSFWCCPTHRPPSDGPHAYLVAFPSSFRNRQPRVLSFGRDTLSSRRSIYLYFLHASGSRVLLTRKISESRD